MTVTDARDRELLDGLLSEHVGQLALQMERPDITDAGRAGYREQIARAEALRRRVASRAEAVRTTHREVMRLAADALDAAEDFLIAVRANVDDGLGEPFNKLRAAMVALRGPHLEDKT